MRQAIAYTQGGVSLFNLLPELLLKSVPWPTRGSGEIWSGKQSRTACRNWTRWTKPSFRRSNCTSITCLAIRRSEGRSSSSTAMSWAVDVDEGQLLACRNVDCIWWSGHEEWTSNGVEIALQLLILWPILSPRLCSLGVAWHPLGRCVTHKLSSHMAWSITGSGSSSGLLVAGGELEREVPYWSVCCQHGRVTNGKGADEVCCGVWLLDDCRIAPLVFAFTLKGLASNTTQQTWPAVSF